MGNAVAYVVRSTPLTFLDDHAVRYYTGSSGRFTYDIRRAKIYPTPKSAEVSHPFSTRKKYPNHPWRDALDTHKVSLVY